MKNLLAIDTSTSHASVALMFQEQVYSLKNDNVKQHAEYLLPMINELLAAAKISLANLDGIVFGAGPGSFTGIRVTCSVVKALAYAHDLDLYPVSSLKSLAYSATFDEDKKDTLVLVMLDARMQEVYWEYSTLMQGNGAQVGRVTDITIPKVEQLIICGPDLDDFLEILPTDIRNLPYVYKNVYPDALSMLRLAQAGHIQPVTAEAALPEYVRNKVVRGAANG